MNYFLSFVISFASIFLKGWQTQNVLGKHLKSIVIVSYLMGFLDILAIGLVVQYGWTIAFTAGTGGALGMLVAVLFHDKVYKR